MRAERNVGTFWDQMFTHRPGLRKLVSNCIRTCTLGKVRRAREKSRLVWRLPGDVPIFEDRRSIAEVDTNPDRQDKGTKQHVGDQESAESFFDAFCRHLCSSLAMINLESGNDEDLIGLGENDLVSIEDKVIA